MPGVFEVGVLDGLWIGNMPIASIRHHDTMSKMLPVIAHHALAEMCKRGWRISITPGNVFMTLGRPLEEATGCHEYDPTNPTALAYAMLCAIDEALGMEDNES